MTLTRKLVSFDWALKRLLRSKANFCILEGFLSELLKQDITILEILESETNQETKNDKYSRVDLKVKNSKNEIILIEVQYESEADFLQRVLYGVSRAITEHFKKGDKYLKIAKVISIAIVYFDLGEGNDYIYHGTTSFIGFHSGDKLSLSPLQKQYFNKKYPEEIYPEIYIIKVNNFNDVAKDTLDEWVYFLKNEEIKDNFKARGLSKAKKELDIMKMNAQQRKEYEAYLDDLSFQASMADSTYNVGKFEGRKEGRIEGRKEGEKIGIKKGEQIGIKKGEEIGIKKGMVMNIIQLAEDGDIKPKRAFEKIQQYRDQINDNAFWKKAENKLNAIK